MILVLIIIFSIELISFIYFYFFNHHYTFFDFDELVPPDEELRRMIEGRVKIHFDAELGWDYKYDTEYGERKRFVKYDGDFMSTFGDSNTHGDEVGDNETWQFYLSDKLDKNVYNFGTSGFGTGQAYLRFRRDYKKVKTKIVTLGLVDGDIQRIVNLYWPLMFPTSTFYLTKPLTIVKDDKLYVIKNPIQHKEDLIKLKDKHFIKMIAKNDYLNNVNLPELSFPYTKIFFNEHFQYEAISRKNQGRYPKREEFWKKEEVVNKIFLIFDYFVREAENKGAIPIIMILARKDNIKYYWKEGDILFLNKTLEYCESKGYLCFNSVETLAESIKNQDDIDSFFHEFHPSAKGTKLIAEGFYEFLDSNDLLDE